MSTIANEYLEANTGTQRLAHDPILVDDGSDDDGSDDHPIFRSIKQLLENRQRHIKNMKPVLDNLTAHIYSTADSDRSSDYNSVRVGGKRSLGDFITAEIDGSDQLRILANNLINKMREY
ncbi:hypothetical protein EG329_006367 [Mollisiaceae sp. DMI_Dod_QoI]|nr:hypothetical protein EG329_006367 [Helotiales sp. DMI_Dod_QoI]